VGEAPGGAVRHPGLDWVYHALASIIPNPFPASVRLPDAGPGPGPNPGRRCMCATVLQACWRCSPLWLLVLAAGCSHQARSVPHASVSGKVIYKGRPLPGGRVTFVTVNGGFAASANIHEDGAYKVDAPVGDVQISVDNSMLLRKRGTPTRPPQSEEMMKRSGGGEKDPIKGHYVDLPSKYATADTSGLTYTVQPGEQTHDITLQ
jgi:hypothetical protein